MSKSAAPATIAASVPPGFESQQPTELSPDDSSSQYDTADSENVSETDSEPLDPLKNCIICTDEIEFFSIGICNHQVCHKCIVRLRFIMDDKTCPVCREELHDVFVSKEFQQYGNFSKRTSYYSKRYQLFLPKVDQKVLLAEMDALTAYACSTCESNTSFGSLHQWQRHQADTHQVFPCDLCLSNEWLFCYEVVLYEKKPRATHKRKEHPICEYCDQRFYDRDILFRHLRREHEYCRICEHATNGGKLEYYNDISELKGHLRADHHYCESPDCNTDQDPTVYSVFRTDIELELHLKQEHSDLPANSKQAKTVRLGGLSRNQNRQPRRQHHQEHESEEEMEQHQATPEAFEVQIEDFPNLAGDIAKTQPTKPTTYSALSLSKQLTSEQNFPSLGGSRPTNTPTVAKSSKQVHSMANTIKKNPKTAAGSRAVPLRVQQTKTACMPQRKVPPKQPPAEAFPSLKSSSGPILTHRFSSAKSNPTPHVLPTPIRTMTPPAAIAQKQTPPSHIPKAPNLGKDDFPSLGGGKPKAPSSVKPLKQFLSNKTRPTLSAASLNPPVQKGPTKKKKAEKKKNPLIKKVEEGPQEDWWYEPVDDPYKYTKGKFAQNIGRQGGGGLVNGQHPLAPKISEPAPTLPVSEERTLSKPVQSSNMDFPTLSGVRKSKKLGGAKGTTWVVPKSQPVPTKPEVVNLEPNFSDGQDFPGLAGPNNNNCTMSSLGMRFKAAEVTSKPAPSNWAGTNIVTKKSKSRKK